MRGVLLPLAPPHGSGKGAANEQKEHQRSHSGLHPAGAHVTLMDISCWLDFFWIPCEIFLLINICPKLCLYFRYLTFIFVQYICQCVSSKMETNEIEIICICGFVIVL